MIWAGASSLGRLVQIIVYWRFGQMQHLLTVREVHDGGGRGSALDGEGVVGARTWIVSDLEH